MICFTAHRRYDTFPNSRVFSIRRQGGDQGGSAIEIACENRQLNQPLGSPNGADRRAFQNGSGFLQVSQAEAASGPVNRDDVVIRREQLDNALGEVFSVPEFAQSDITFQELDRG